MKRSFLILACLLTLGVVAEDLPCDNAILDLGGKTKVIENWEWPGWNGYAMRLTNGTLRVTGRMQPKHGGTDIFKGATLSFAPESLYTPGCGDAQPRWTVIHNGGTLEMEKCHLNPFNARFIMHPGSTVRLGIDLKSTHHKNIWRVKGGKLVITDHVVIEPNEFFVETNAVLEIDIAAGKYLDFSRAIVSPGAKIIEKGKGYLIRSHDDPRWKKGEIKRAIDRISFKARGDTANRCYSIYFRPETTNAIKNVYYECPEFGIRYSNQPYFTCRYPKDAKGPFSIRAVVVAKDGSKERFNIDIPYNPNPITKPLPNEKFLLGVVSYGAGRERYEMVTNDLGNLYVRWGSWQQLLPENATEEWLKEAKKKGIYCMTIYANCPAEKREEIKKAWEGRYLGNNCGERTGFFYGHRKEMRGPQNMMLPGARNWFISNFFRGNRDVKRGVKGEDPFAFATSGAAIANWELPAGIDYVCNELYAVGCQNITYATAEARGAARKWGPEWWSGWLAHEWQSFPIQYDNDVKYLSLEAGIKSLWVMGTSLLCLESGSSGTQAHPYTWGANREGYKYDDDPPRRYRETIRKCNIFAQNNPRAKGTPETKIALAMGTYDGYIGFNSRDIAPWAQHTNRIVHINEKINIWACSQPEVNWDLARSVFFPYSGTFGVSGMPYGQVDVIGVDDMCRLEDIERYSLMAFGGWNTMTTHARKVLEAWIKNGGTCIISVPQLSKRDDRRFLDYTKEDLMPICGLKVEDFEMVGDLKIGVLKNMSNVEVVKTYGPAKKPIAVRKKHGNGWIYLMLAYQYPSARGDTGKIWKELLAECAAKVEQKIVLKQDNKDDELRFFIYAAYPGKGYLMNVDMKNPRKVRTVIDGKEVLHELQPLEVKTLKLR